MALWNSTIHAPSAYEMTRLRMSCKGKSGGADSEWGWHGGKRRNVAEHPALSGTNIGMLYHILKRNADAISGLSTWGNSKEGVTQFDSYFDPKKVRTPDKILKVRKGPEKGTPLALIAEKCEGLEGDFESEWSITRVNGDNFVAFFSSIPSVAGRLIRRNAAAITNYRVLPYGGGQFGVSLVLRASECRHPTTLLRVGR